MILVPDASVAVKWYVNEIHTNLAELLLCGGYDLHAPELIVPEFGNIIWKKVRLKELTRGEGEKIVGAFGRLPITFHSHSNLLNAAFFGAAATDKTVYDWIYLALAVSLSRRFVTADARFFQAIAATPLKKHVLWVEDLQNL